VDDLVLDGAVDRGDGGGLQGAAVARADPARAELLLQLRGRSLVPRRAGWLLLLLLLLGPRRRRRLLGPCLLRFRRRWLRLHCLLVS
jgi:hypothetical protein